MAPSIWSLPGGNSNALVKDSDHSFAPCQSFGRSSTRDELLNEVWGFENYPSTRTVDNHIATLRAKLENNPAEPRHLLTVHGVGYNLILIHTSFKQGVNERSTYIFLAKKESKVSRCFAVYGVLWARNPADAPADLRTLDIYDGC